MSTPDDSLKYLKSWISKLASLNLQWNVLSIREKFIYITNSEIRALICELLRILKDKNYAGIKNEIIEKYISKNGTANNFKIANLELNIKTDQNIPFKINKNNIVGRHLVTTRNIKAGEVILIEGRISCGPIVQHPYHDDFPSCINCFTKATIFVCPECGFFLCRNEICKNAHISESECKYLSRLELLNDQQHIHNLEKKNFRNMIMQRSKEDWMECLTTLSSAYIGFINEQKNKIFKFYPAIPTLKVLCYIEKNMEMKELILTLQGNVTDNSKRYKINQKHIVDVIKRMNMPYSEEFIHQIAALWDTNAFQSKLGNIKIQVMFILSSFYTHSCKPNCENIFTKSSDLMILRAVEDIANNSVLTISYTDQFWPTYIRRDHLRISKSFICNCERCIDPTEYGTLMGHTICNTCNKTSICANYNQENEGSLICSNCNQLINKSEYFSIEASTCKMLANIKDLDIRKYDEVISKIFQTFHGRYHKNHHIFQRIRLSLFLEYSVKDLSVLSDDDLQKMRALSLDFYHLCAAILPRLSYKKAQIAREAIRYMNEICKRQGKTFEIDDRTKIMMEESELVTNWIASFSKNSV